MDLQESYQEPKSEYCIECRRYEHSWLRIFNMADLLEQILKKKDVVNEMRKKSIELGEEKRNLVLYSGICSSCNKYSPCLYDLEELDSILYEEDELTRIVSEREEEFALRIVSVYNEVRKKYSAEVALGILEEGLKEYENRSLVMSIFPGKALA